MDLSKRSPEEVVKAHLDALNAADLEAIMRDYADDALLITADGVVNGKQAIRGLFQSILPMAMKFELASLVAVGDLVYIDGRAEGPSAVVEDATDTFIVRDGLIVGQTARMTVLPKN
jgi:ketosteroid isomerase-like protein